MCHIADGKILLKDFVMGSKGVAVAEMGRIGFREYLYLVVGVWDSEEGGGGP
jgi:hypothetical protein